jgi:hypothetical protein
MPFLWKSTSRVPDQKYQLCDETSLLAASALCPVGVAHVSRLIGKFDTTENRSGWQVGFAETFSVCTLQTCPNAPNATRKGVAFLCLAQVTGLPNQLRAVVISTAPTTGSSGRSPLEGPLLWRLALAGSCCFSGWSGYFPSAGTSLALLFIAIHGPFLLLPVFMDLRDSRGGSFLDSGRGMKV